MHLLPAGPTEQACGTTSHSAGHTTPPPGQHLRPPSGTIVCMPAAPYATLPSWCIYLAAIRHSHLERGYQDPLIDKPLLDYLCKCIRRHQGYQTRASLPLTSSLLTDLRTTLNHSSTINSYDKQAMRAAIYHPGLLRFPEGGRVYHKPQSPISNQQAPPPQRCDSGNRQLLSCHQRVEN